MKDSWAGSSMVEKLTLNRWQALCWIDFSGVYVRLDQVLAYRIRGHHCKIIAKFGSFALSPWATNSIGRVADS